jgi:hypothetical protein
VKPLKIDDITTQQKSEITNVLELNFYFPDITLQPPHPLQNKRIGKAATATGLRLDDRRNTAPFPATLSRLLVLENVQNVAT